MKILVTSLPDLMKLYPQRSHHLVRYLTLEHDVTVLCTNTWWLPDVHDDYVEKSLKNVEFAYLSKHKTRSILQEISFCKNFGTFRKRFGLDTFDIHLNLNSPIAGYYLTKRLKLATILDIYDDLPKWARTSTQVPFLLRPIGEIVGRFILNKNIQLATRITYITKSLDNTYKFPQNKAVLVPNGVDTQLFRKRHSPEIKERLKIGDKFVIGYVGGLKEWVDLEPIFAAIRKLGEKVGMIVIGKEGRFEENIKLAREYGIADNVIFTGSIPYSQVPKYIGAMDACLVPFKANSITNNALPLKLFEYMACEKPVISTPLAGVKEAVGNRVLYAPNADTIKQRVLQLHRNEDLREKLGREGRRFVEQNYRWEVISHKFEKVIEEVAAV